MFAASDHMPTFKEIPVEQRPQCTDSISQPTQKPSSAPPHGYLLAGLVVGHRRAYAARLPAERLRRNHTTPNPLNTKATACVTVEASGMTLPLAL